MHVLQIEERSAPPSFALFELGFRPFFSGAGLFAVLSILLWMAIYVFSVPLAPAGLAGTLWHAHEMVFGYAMAVVAGFLLTAVGNWTGIRGLRGSALAALLLLWAIARVAYFLPVPWALTLAAVADLLFALGLIAGVSLPVFRVRQWTQLGVITKLWLMLLCNAIFYAGALGYLDQGIRWGLYTGIYIILALIFTMARRVVPFFIERGVDEAFSARNRRWVDFGSLVLFAAWAVLDVFSRQAVLVALLSLPLVAIHVLRMRDWYTPGIWKAPLLWSLYLGYGFLVLGFVLKALSVWPGISPTLALHAFAVGGIGLITIGMMSRVALGHTGRNVFDPPKVLVPMFALVVLGALTRVVAPIIDGSHYTFWIAASQVMWMLGFGIFSAVYVPILIRPRVDGRPG
jgi:uncharacterized protein involved in response to NO